MGGKGKQVDEGQHSSLFNQWENWRIMNHIMEEEGRRR